MRHSGTALREVGPDPRACDAKNRQCNARSCECGNGGRERNGKARARGVVSGASGNAGRRPLCALLTIGFRLRKTRFVGDRDSPVSWFKEDCVYQLVGEKRRTMKTIVQAFVIAALTSTVHAATVTVPGIANPWLAGMADGTVATGGSPNAGDQDTAPAHSPAHVVGLTLTPGASLHFTVTGSVNNNPFPSGDSPDGGTDGLPDFQYHTPENGMSGFGAPINSLIGVFLSDSVPTLSPQTIESTYAPNSPTSAPALQQVFFIGDGLTGTGSGARQQFMVPAGATRLYLGALDGTGWNNNFGSFQVLVEQTVADTDGDGVNDSQDQCPGTDPGAVVDANGCSVAQLVPCEGPWKNHGQYVSSVAHVVEAFVFLGLLSEEEAEAIVSSAARSDCGKKRFNPRGKVQ